MSDSDVYHVSGVFLQGGFARVYEVVDARNVRHAIKVINKSALKTTKNRTKARSLRPSDSL